MLRIAICDDNNVVCSQIEDIILGYKRSNLIEIETEVFWSGESLIEFIENSVGFDLIFLDIELGTTTGVEISKKIRNEFKDNISKIVFVSSKTEYYSELFQVQPFNFIQKPINNIELINCIELAMKILNIENTTFEYKFKKNFKKVELKNILYFENKLRKVKIVTNDGEDYFYDSLENVKNKLPKTFITPHISYIVNYNNIEQICGETIHMSNDAQIPISRSNLKEIHKLQIQLVREKKNDTI